MTHPLDCSKISNFLLGAIVEPLQVVGSVNEAGTEGSHDDVVALAKLGFVFPECEGDGGSRGVAEVLNVDHHLLHRHFQSLGYGFDDAHVGLMGDYPVDVVLVQSVALSYECAVVAHVGDGIAEHGATFLLKPVETKNTPFYFVICTLIRTFASDKSNTTIFLTH